MCKTDINLQNRVRYFGKIEDFAPITKIIDGNPVIFMPTRYKRVYKNETGGLTTELSLTPFENEQAKESNPC